MMNGIYECGTVLDMIIKELENLSSIKFSGYNCFMNNILNAAKCYGNNAAVELNNYINHDILNRWFSEINGNESHKTSILKLLELFMNKCKLEVI